MSLSKTTCAFLIRRVAILAMVTVLAGCAVWTRVETATQEGPGNKYTVQAPLGWVRFNAASDGILISRDGVAIQHILIVQQTDDAYFKKTKAKLPKNVAPSDLAQLILAELRSEKELANLQVKESVPLTVAGQPGFKVHIQYRNERGALFDRVILGTSKANSVTIMTYHGLNTHYFARDLDTFYGVARSFKPA